MKTLQFLIKPASSACNLRCQYCFYEDIAQNRSLPYLGAMTQDTVQSLIDAAYDAIEPQGAIHFAFQGGEPTLAGLEFYRDFIRRVEDKQRPDVAVSYSIQTNGILLDESWAAFFREQDFLVGISLDGYRELHDLYRVDSRKAGSWRTASQAFRLLTQAGVRTNALCVVTAQCAKHPEKVYRELKKLGADYLQFIPCLDPIARERGQMDYSLTPKAYGQFLCRLFDLWYQDWRQGQYRSIRLFDDYIHILLGTNSMATCSTCGRCGQYYVVEGDGSVYPCDFFVLDRWKMGTIGKDTLKALAASAQAQDFAAWGQEKPPACGSCRWKILCNGGCKNDWDTSGSHSYCEALKAFFAHAERRLVEIAKAELQARRELGAY